MNYKEVHLPSNTRRIHLSKKGIFTIGFYGRISRKDKKKIKSLLANNPFPVTIPIDFLEFHSNAFISKGWNLIS